MSKYLRRMDGRNNTNYRNNIEEHNFSPRFDDRGDMFFDRFNSPFPFADLQHSSSYNIKRLGNDEYEIQVNVAGFHKDEISVSQNGNQLIIEGNSYVEGKTKDYVYQGFSSSFSNTFSLGPNAEILDAQLSKGILSIIVYDKNLESRKNIPVR